MAHHAPTWQPITRLPLIVSMVDGMLEAAAEQYQTLQAVRSKPHVLDDATVARVIQVYTTQRDDLWLFAEQARRWAGEPVTPAQHQEIQRLISQVARLRTLLDAILALADALQAGTIDRVLALSDEELALEVLLGRRQAPEH